MAFRIRKPGKTPKDGGWWHCSSASPTLQAKSYQQAHRVDMHVDTLPLSLRPSRRNCAENQKANSMSPPPLLFLLKMWKAC